MKKLISTLLTLGFLSTSLFGQFFFIPVLIPSSDYYISYKCPTTNSLAIEYIQKGTEKYDLNINASIVYFKGAIAKDSLFCDAYHYLVVCYRKTKKYDSAFKYIDLALKVNASDLCARETKGLLFMDIDDYMSSSKYFLDQIKIQPEEPVWHYYHSKSLIELNLLDSARNTAIKMHYLLLSKDNIYAQSMSFYLQAKIAFKKRDYYKALNAYKQIFGDYKNDAEYRYFYGLCYLEIDKPNERKAKKHIEKSIELGYNKIDIGLIKRLDIKSSSPDRNQGL